MDQNGSQRDDMAFSAAQTLADRLRPVKAKAKQLAIENGHLKWIFPLNIVIFHSYVSLQEGIMIYLL